MENKQVGIGKMEKQLKQWGARLDAMTEKVTAAGAKAKADERKVVADLREKQELAQAKLDEVRAAGADKWDTFKAGVEGAYHEIEAAFKKLGN